MPREVHPEFTNLLCHRALHGAINHAFNLPVSLSRGKLPCQQPVVLPLTHLMRTSSNWSTLNHSQECNVQLLQQQQQWLAGGGDIHGPPWRRQESPWGASLAQGPEASGKPGEPREEPSGMGRWGVWGRSVRDERERQTRKEGGGGRKEGGCQSPGSPTFSIPGCPGEPGISHGLYPPHGYRLGPTLCVSSPSLIGTEIQRASIRLAQYCLALTPKWKGWEHRPFRDQSCAHHLSLCTHFSKHIKLWTGCFLCLGCCALLHLPGDLLVVLGPDQISLTVRCPFKLPWAREVTCPSSAQPSTRQDRPLRPPCHTIPPVSTGSGVPLTTL